MSVVIDERDVEIVHVAVGPAKGDLEYLVYFVEGQGWWEGKEAVYSGICAPT